MLRYDLARGLRTRTTDVERLLWKLLRNRQLENYKFRRQQPIGQFIVDFVCQEQRLIVELDGGQHADQIAADKRRDAFLENAGYRIVRFWNNQILQETKGVIETVLEALSSPATPHPALRVRPLPQGERGNKKRPAQCFASPLEGEAALRPVGAGRVRGQ